MSNTATDTDHTTRTDAPTECPFARQIGFGLHAPRMVVELTADSDWHGMKAGERTFAWTNTTNSTTLWTPTHMCEWSTGLRCKVVG